MSTDVLAVTVLPGPPAAPGHLILGVDEAGVLYEVAGDQPGGDVVHCVRAWDAVVERIAQSAGVVIEHGRNQALCCGDRGRRTAPTIPG